MFIILYTLNPNLVFIGPKTWFNLALNILSALFDGKSDFFKKPMFVSLSDKSKYFLYF